ncbi:MAG: restriction endonuclease subunit S [Ruminococcus sp.]|nr:restriction endonuclease subunit S [Ruminococcus sp.]
MNDLETLIQQLCPNGVEYKKLGDIATDIFRGAGITRDQVTEEGTPCVRYGEIYTTYGIYFDTCVSHTDESTIQSKKYFEHGDILFAITGESVEDIAKSTAYVGYEKCLAGGDIVVLKHKQNPKYLSYVLSTTSAQAQKSKGKVKSKVVHSSVPAIKDIVIPVPPMEVQAEIVKILDEYSTSVTALQQELEKELTARKKQYEYYRDLLLDFGVHGGATSECEWRTLGELVDFRNGKGHEKDIVSFGDYIVVNSKFISTQGQVVKYSDKQICPLYIDDILMVMSDLPNGRALAKCYLVSEDNRFTLNQRIGCFHVKNEDTILTMFLFYVLNRNKQLLKYDNGVDQTNLKKNDILNIVIPVPPIEEQERIVNILDRFDKLCNDISEGLPAEIEARRKQYEYYRDKLLSFEERKNA